MSIHRDIAVQALGIFCNLDITQFESLAAPLPVEHLQLHIKNFLPTLLKADQQSVESDSHLSNLQNGLQEVPPPSSANTLSAAPPRSLMAMPAPVERSEPKSTFLNKDEFFDPPWDYDFSNLKDTATFMRGGEVYERPCGWQRFALKVLDKYEDNVWLGSSKCTQSDSGEWPVSFHGTSRAGFEGIITGDYEPGSGQAYGRGIYSSPHLRVATAYAKEFTSQMDGKRYKAILQNRINPKYREKHNNDQYWLVRIPAGTSPAEEDELVSRAIRPYGLLLKAA